MDKQRDMLGEIFFTFKKDILNFSLINKIK